MSGGSISGNTAVSIGPGAGTCSGKGGGIYNSDELLTVRGAQLSGNTASCGGAEYLRNYNGNNFYSSRLTGNYASYYGGAFYGETLTAGGTVLNSTVVIGNTAGTETGGFYAQAFGTFLLEGSTIAGNTGGACPNTNFPCD
jgi:predicted outer membrane repeat protein